MRDDDGELVQGGDSVQFSYGIPPVRVVAKLVQRRNKLLVLTPGHAPAESNLRNLRKHVGEWFKLQNPNHTIGPGFRFFYDQNHVVVRKHERIPDRWWCRGAEEDCGLSAFHENTIWKNSGWRKLPQKPRPNRRPKAR